MNIQLMIGRTAALGPRLSCPDAHSSYECVPQERQSMRSRRSGPVSAALLTVPLLLGVAGAPSMRVALPGTVPAWAAPAADRGEVAATAPVTVRVYLAGRERAGLAALARA